MMSALCTRFLILAFGIAVMVVNTSGQSSSKKPPSKKNPAKPTVNWVERVPAKCSVASVY